MIAAIEKFPEKWDAVDAILTDYANAIETLSSEVAEECRKAWYI